MGNIIAIGGGFEGAALYPLARFIIKLAGKEKPNYLYIPTTSYDIMDRDGVAVFSKSGCRVETLFLTHPYITEEIIADKIRRADIIHVPGGNLRFCIETWRETHADRYLREAFEAGKTLFGSSSGSMCWFRKGYDNCGPDDSFMFTDGLGLLPYCNGGRHFHRRLRERRGCLLSGRKVVPLRIRSASGCARLVLRRGKKLRAVRSHGASRDPGKALNPNCMENERLHGTDPYSRCCISLIVFTS